MTLIIEVSSPDWIITTKEVSVICNRYNGTTGSGGDDPSTCEIVSCECDGRDVTDAMDAIFGLLNLQDKLEIQ
jgi:hypothetical protein